MAVVNLTGFETADLLECSASSGAVAAQSGTVRNSGYALRANPTGANAASVTVTGLSSSGDPSSTSATDSYVRFYFRFAALPAVGTQTIFRLFNGSAALKLSVGLKTSGVLVATDAASAATDGTAVLSADTWYRINVVCGTHDSTAVIQVDVDGVSDVNTTGDTTNSAAGSLQLGRPAGANEDVDYYFDDLVWDDASAPGAGAIMALLPSADGEFTAGTANGAATKWGCLRERPNDGDTTYVNGLSPADSYVARLDLTGVSVTSGVLLKVVVIVDGDFGGASYSIVTRLNEPASAFSQDSAGSASSSSYEAKCLISDGPIAGGDWDDASLANVEAGWVESGPDASRVTAVYGMLSGAFTYTPPTPIKVARRRQRQTAARFPAPLTQW